MELKKSKEANLEDKRIVFFFVGLVMVSAIVLMGFQYETAKVDEVYAVEEDEGLGEELVFEIPPEEEIPEEEPETAPPPPVIEEIEVVDDDEEVEDIDFSAMEEDIDEVPDDEPEEIVEEPIADFAEVEPSFPGGESAMMEWIRDNIEYPQLSVEMGEQGIVYCQFVVNKDGSIEQVKVVRGVSDALDDEAKRVVRRMPKWTPGEQAGKKVRCRFTLPIHFRLG
ncbi:MAG: energy transducer TonB [Flavobacteriales bacterium]|jgi:protein TonB|nr:energy transducer TonB [Flavobacteriales bacterium]